jgi:hypothetical protein
VKTSADCVHGVGLVVDVALRLLLTLSLLVQWRRGERARRLCDAARKGNSMLHLKQGSRA